MAMLRKALIFLTLLLQKCHTIFITPHDPLSSNDVRSLRSLLLSLRPIPSSLSSRRAVLGTLAAFSVFQRPALSVETAQDATKKKLGNDRPNNNYYFPMAKYRYLPRIFRAWVAVDLLASPALKAGDWDGMNEVWYRLDDASTAMPLYTNSIEGARSTKRKKKSDTQKQLATYTKTYAAACENLGQAVKRRDAKKSAVALAAARESLLSYRKLAQIDDENGGVLDAEAVTSKSGSKITGTGAVVPAFRGGGNPKSLSKEAIYTLKPKAVSEIDAAGPLQKDYNRNDKTEIRQELQEDLEEFQKLKSKRR